MSCGLAGLRGARRPRATAGTEDARYMGSYNTCSNCAGLPHPVFVVSKQMFCGTCRRQEVLQLILTTAGEGRGVPSKLV